jgi:aerobic carbon-monoxide dehydrogenase medium subunit
MTLLTYLPKFAYYEPETVAEACSLISKSANRAKILAGGTDLLVKMKRGLERPESLVSLKRITTFSEIRYVPGESLNIGALVTISRLIASSIINEEFEILGQAAGMMALPQVRNRGTVGGNLCNASPAADTAPALVAMGSQVSITGLTGERIIPLEEFFTGPGQTALHQDEILTEIRVPVPSSRAGGSYAKLSLRHHDLATVSVAAMVVFSPEGRVCEDARIVLGAVAPTVIRSHQAEQVLKGRTLDEGVIKEAARAASETTRPISDIRASAGYRKEMVMVLAGRAIEQAVEAARKRLHSSGGQAK